MKDKELRKFLGLHHGGWWDTNLCGCYLPEPQGEIPHLNRKIDRLEQRVSELEKRLEKKKK